jgi:serine/threonine-protein kinase
VPSIGERLAGRYRLDARIGSGGFAAVFRARDLRLDRDVAVKVLLAHHATDPVIAARFDREARVLAAVSHPNVVAVHDVGHGGPGTSGEPFLVMDLSDGGSLADLLAASETGALPPDRLVPILVDVAAGLDALHARGIVHRDLKPSNVLLSDGRARIADLGIAAAGPSELTAIGTTVGTLAYLAPEQLAGAPASPAGDVHALGVIAFLGLTGRLPRPAGSVTEIVAASVRVVEPVSALVPGLGSAFDRTIARALAGEPSQRPAAIELGAALAAGLERWRARPAWVAPYDATTLTVLPFRGHPRAATNVAPTPRRDRRMVAAVGILVVAVLLGLGAFLVLGSGGPSATASPSSPGSGSGSSPSTPASPPQTATPTAPPTAAPTPSPTPSPPPTAAVDPYGNAREASEGMRVAIATDERHGGLNVREAKDLESRLTQFDRALVHRDPMTARDEAKTLAGQIAELVDKRAVDAQTAARLQAAADRLVAAASALPD